MITSNLQSQTYLKTWVVLLKSISEKKSETDDQQLTEVENSSEIKWIFTYYYDFKKDIYLHWTSLRLCQQR